MKLTSVVDRPATRLSPARLAPFLTDNLLRVIRALERYQFEVRIVGGAVRDLLADLEPRDIDLATDALPDQIIWVLQTEGLTLSTKGITHGTVKVKFEGEEEYEITSLDFRMKVVDGKLQVLHARDWRQDAQRRDFTINALSMDLEGNVYDYVGGLKDLRDHRVRFIGPMDEKIEADPVLILRLFKLISKFARPLIDKRSLLVVKQHRDALAQIKPERVQLELSNIEHGVNAKTAITLMSKLGLDQFVELPQAT